MTTFELPKDLDDIQEAKLLDDDWYTARITKEPQVRPNAKKRDGKGPEEGGGDNIVLKLRLVSDDPEVNGRPFTKWLPLPSPGDDKRYDEFKGITLQDSKMENIRTWSAAFQGVDPKELKGNEVDFEVGDEAQVYVTSDVNFRNEEEFVNVLHMNIAPRPI